MLARNNGITLRAGSVNFVSEQILLLSEASIVNGCQTTMSVVQNAKAEIACHVAVKVVQTDEAWDVAHATNNQNAPSEFDLQLAQYWRPQLVNKAASRWGVRLSYGNDAFSVMSAIYQTEIAYGEVRALFIGLFSRSPRNVFDSNYTELRSDALKILYAEDPEGSALFELLFDVQAVATSCITELEDTLKTMMQDQETDTGYVFRRFFRAGKPEYRSYLSLLAVSEAVGIDISRTKRTYSGSGQSVFEVDFLQKVLAAYQADEKRFIRCYKAAFKAIVSYVFSKSAEKGRDAILKEMYNIIKGAPFDYLLQMTHMDMSM